MSGFSGTYTGTLTITGTKGTATIVYNLITKNFNRTRSCTIGVKGGITNCSITARSGTLTGTMTINGKQFTINQNLGVDAN